MNKSQLIIDCCLRDNFSKLVIIRKIYNKIIGEEINDKDSISRCDFEYQSAKIKKSKKMLDKKMEEFRELSDMDYNILNPEEQEEYERLKKEEEQEEEIDTISNRLNEGTELFKRCEAEARSQ